MKTKSILTFVLLAVITASFCFTSCSEDEKESNSEYYSDWMEVTDADSIVFAKARMAFINDPENAGSASCKLLESLPDKPKAVKIEIEEKGKYYQFAFQHCEVTVYKGNGDKVGRVTLIVMVEAENRPIRRDTITE